MSFTRERCVGSAYRRSNLFAVPLWQRFWKSEKHDCSG
jgi:hypothetical protein